MFIILTAPRTGSELLISALAAHPELRVESEILNPHRYQEWRRSLLHDSLNYTAHIDPAVPISTIIFDHNDRLVELVRRAFGVLDGFKITYDQITTASPVVDYLRSLADLKVIFLQRNYLDSAISCWFAIRSQIWQIDHASPPHHDQPQEINQEFVNHFCRFARDNDLFYHQAFGNHNYRLITYNQLVEDWTGVLLMVQQYLGIRPVELKMPLRKRLSRPLDELVLNLGTLRQSIWAGLP